MSLSSFSFLLFLLTPPFPSLILLDLSLSLPSQTCQKLGFFLTFLILNFYLLSSFFFFNLRRSNQSNLREINLEIFFGRTVAEAPIRWPPDAKSQLVGKDPDAGKD